MITISYADAQQKLALLTAPGNSYTAQDLFKLAGQVTLEVYGDYTQGSVTVFYSGPIGGASSAEVMNALMETPADIRIIDKTQAAQFLNSLEFRQAFQQVATAADKAFLIHATEGPWAQLSERFAMDTFGDVRFMGANAWSQRIFGLTELPAMLHPGSLITSIEGIPIETLREMGTEKAFEAIRVQSLANLAGSGLHVTLDSAGKVSAVDLGDFLNHQVADTLEYAKTHPEAVQRINDYVSSLPDAEKSSLKALLHNAKHLGPVAEFLLLGFAVSQAHAASSSGDTEGARKIMEAWAIETAGGAAGAAIGATVVSVALAALSAPVSIPVAAALGIGAAIVGGIYGSDAATSAWDAIRANADDGSMNILEQLAAKVALANYNVVFGSTGPDVLSGSAGKDYLFGGSGDDTLAGGVGDDVLRGGSGNDEYQFGATWGKDVVADSDGVGSIRIEGQPLGAIKSVGLGNVWNVKLDNGQVLVLALYDDKTSSTGKKLVILRAGSTADSITITNFDLAKAKSAEGYLGIKLPDSLMVAIEPNGNDRNQPALDAGVSDVNANPFQSTNFNAQALVGASSTATSKSFTVYFNQAVKAGATLVLHVGDLAAAGLMAVQGATTVSAQGATFQLAEGQTQLTFTLMKSDGTELDSDITGSVSVVVTDGSQTATSNAWNLTWKNHPDPTEAITGDNPQGTTLKDLLAGTANPDLIRSLTDNDALLGMAGADEMEGGSGSDIMMGGTGADTMRGGSGDDVIYGSSNGVFGGALPENPQNVIAEGQNWIYYGPGTLDQDGFANTWLAGIQRDIQQGDAGNEIEGGDGNDRVLAGTGDDLVEGGEGRDDIDGMGGSDVLLGDAGDDRLRGDGSNNAELVDYTPPSQAGADFLDGGTGNDVALGQGGNDDVFGGDDDDELWGDDRQPADTPAESHGIDYLDGELGNDTLYGGGRDDELYGGDGDDELWGDDDMVGNIDASFHGDDYIDAENGNDSLWGGGRDDVLFGGLGNDVVYGDDPLSERVPEAQQGRDYLDGEAGNDSLVGGAKEDDLFGDEGDDVLWGDDGGHAPGETGSLDPASDGADYLDGEAGNDALVGEGQNDVLFGGDGNDTLLGDDEVARLAAGFHGDDTLDGEGGDDDLAGNGGHDVLAGGEGNDVLYGDDDDVPEDEQGDDELDGGDGDDGLKGHGGDDFLAGGLGADTLQGDAGLDLLAGGDGADILYGGDDEDVLEGDAGSDSLLGEAGDDELSGGDDGDQLEGGDGNDLLSGDGAGDSLYGGEGDDWIDGAEGNDYLQGDGGADVMTGGDGDDFARGEAGDDQVYGDAGNDQLQGNDGNDSLDGGAGADTLFGQAGDDELDGGADADQLQGGDGNDTLWGEGLDELFGQGGDDILVGDGAGGVYMSGGDGNDFLMEGDTMLGGAGDDTIRVESGSVIDGGAGNDTYLYHLADGSSALLLWMQDTNGANNIEVTGVAPGSITLAPSLPLQWGQPMDLSMLRIETPSGRIDIQDMLSGSVGTISINGDSRSASEFFGQHFIYAMDQSSGAASAVLQGGMQGESLTATGGSSTLSGGAGADTLAGSGGNNVYTYNRGDGIDTVTDTSPAGQGGTLKFGAGLAPADARLSNDNGALVITFGTDAANAVRITGFNANNAAQPTGVTTFAFADGTSMTHAELIARGFDIAGSAADESLVGTNLGDRLTGSGGSDTLSGRAGADTYTFKLGDGSDLIADGDTAAGNADALVFGEGIAPADLVGLRSGNDVTLVVAGTSNQVTLKSYFAGGADAVEQIRFADGTQWGQAEVLVAVQAGNSVDWVLHGDSGNNTLLGMGGNDQLFGHAGMDQLHGGPGDDTLTGGLHDDSLFGGAGSDVYIAETGTGDIDWANESAGGDAEGVDTIRFQDVTSTQARFLVQGNNLNVMDGSGLVRMVVVNQFLSDGTANQVERFEFADGVTLTAAQIHAKVMTGGVGAEYLNGSPLSDTMFANWGADTVSGGAGNDTIHADQGQDWMNGEAGDDALFGDAGDDTVIGAEGNDVLDGGIGWDRLDGGQGNDTYAFGVGSGMDIVTADAGGVDAVQLGANITAANVKLWRVSAPAASDLAYGGDSLVIQLNDGGDQLWIANYFASGNPGHVETIRFADGTSWDFAAVQSRLQVPQAGGTAGTVSGTTKANTFTVDHWNDVINDPSYADADVVNASVSWHLPESVSVANLTGTLNLFVTGSGMNDQLRGNAGDNRFVHHVDEANSATDPGFDVLSGGRGNDLYVVTASNVEVQPSESPFDRGGATITELAGEGTDTLMTGYWSSTLPDNVENLILVRPNAVTGNYFYFYASSPSDYTHRFTGNALANVIDATQYEDFASSQPWISKRSVSYWSTVAEFRLDGGAGADTLVGGIWNDTYVIDNAGDTVTELGIWRDGRDVSIDTVETPFETSLATQFPNIENVTLTGTATVNASGNALNNRLDGSLNSAANRLTGGAGDDTYVVGTADTVVELAGEGTDTVIVASAADGTARLADYANVENIRLQNGAGSLGAVGTEEANQIVGSFGGNVLSGLGGNDTIVDQRIVDVTYYNGPNPNGDNDLLDGGAGNDYLQSYGGADTFAGGAGDDHLHAHYTGRSVTVLMGPGGGVDLLTQDAGRTLNVTVQLATGIRQGDVQLLTDGGMQSVLLADGTRLDTQAANTVTLVFQDGVQLDGTSGADLLVGGGSNDTLSGGAGNDTLAGGRGGDLYVIDPGTGHDVIDDLFTGSGYAVEDGKFDLVQFGGGLLPSGVTVLKQVTGAAETALLLRLNATGDSVALMQSYAAGAGAIEAVRFQDGTQWDLATLKTLVAGTVGSGGNDTLTGGAGNDVLDGAAGSDSMAGGAGNDTYHVDRGGDIVTEASGAGTDTVISWFDGYVLPANVERGQLAAGTDAWRITGNTLANHLTGNAGDNRIDGGTGIDTLVGGAGNDTYVVDVAGDAITEVAGEGWDMIESPLALTLPANVEGLRLTGTGRLSATGNAGANALLGGTGVNTLNGAGGADVLYGDAGNDVLQDTSGNGALDGGAGNDTLTVGSGSDFLAGGAGNDTITFGSGADIFAFNRGDGIDAVNAPTAGAGQGEANDTVSLGRVRLDEIRLSRETSDLVIKINGTTDALRLKGWYTSSANQTVVQLQLVVDSASDYAPASQDALRSSSVTVLDFKELVAAYDAARVSSPNLVNWQPSEAQLQAAWMASSNEDAYGGTAAYRYAKDGTLASVNFEGATGQMAAAGFGTTMQDIAIAVVGQPLAMPPSAWDAPA